MIVVYHQKDTITSVENEFGEVLSLKYSSQLTKGVLDIATTCPDDLIIWCHVDLKAYLNLDEIPRVFHHKHILSSYSTSSKYLLEGTIDFLERMPCLTFDKNKTYSTYLMSNDVGGIYSSVLLKLVDVIDVNYSFEYTLNSLAYLCQPKGLFCYSNPDLLKPGFVQQSKRYMPKKLQYHFVKSHFKKHWLFFFFLCDILYNKSFSLFSFFSVLRLRQLKVSSNAFKATVHTRIIKDYKLNVDVLIPTIGRADYLYDVLKDLSKQTILPKQVIIVEQQADSNLGTALDYLETESWPFKITHEFTYTLGVCNARNIGLKHIENDWVFFADDDVRFDKDLFEKTFDFINNYNARVVNYACLMPQQIQNYIDINQTYIFGSGSSFVSSKIASLLEFDEAYEFGFGEDTDYGCKIRALGYDVVFTPHIKLTHLKAPIGGFRAPIEKSWDKELVQPKPAPTMLYLYRKYFTPNQMKGYKLFLFIQTMSKKSVLKWFTHYKYFNKAWKTSEFYATKLKENHNA